MFCVGFSIGNDKTTFHQFKNIPLRYLFLPLFTLLGTLIGVFCIALLSGSKHISEYLAIGSGFGYYSLSSILITQYKGISLGAIALLANVFREVITLIFAPLMVKYFGSLAPIAAGGATTMDTTFPIIVKSSGNEYVILSIYHGFIMDLSVPFLVTLFCLLKF